MWCGSRLSPSHHCIWMCVPQVYFTVYDTLKHRLTHKNGGWAWEGPCRFLAGWPDKGVRQLPGMHTVRQHILRVVWLLSQRLTVMPGNILVLERGCCRCSKAWSFKSLVMFRQRCQTRGCSSLLSCSMFADLFHQVSCASCLWKFGNMYVCMRCTLTHPPMLPV